MKFNSFLLVSLCMVYAFLIPAGAIVPTPELKWQLLYGGNQDDHAKGIVQTADGDFILLGLTYSNNNGDIGSNHGNMDSYLTKITGSGTILWSHMYGGNAMDYPTSLSSTFDGGYVFAGFTTTNNNGDVGPNHGGEDGWIVKVDSNGTLEWQKVLGGVGNDRFYHVQQTLDGGYILNGQTYSNNNGDVGPSYGGCDYWVVKLNATGNLQWERPLGGAGTDMSYFIQRTQDKGFILIGETDSSNSGLVGTNHGRDDIWVIKLNESGSIDWQRLYGGSSLDMGSSIQQTMDGGYILTGAAWPSNDGDYVGLQHNGGNDDIWVAKLNATGGIQWSTLLGGTGNEVAEFISPTKDGGYVLTGYTSSSGTGDVGPSHGYYDYWVAKLDSLGTLEWEMPYGGNAFEGGRVVRPTLGGAYIVIGETLSYNSGDVGITHGGADAWILKIGNGAPVLNSIENQIVEENSTLEFYLTSHDEDNDELNYGGSNLPNGASLNAETGFFSWTPSYLQAGCYTVNFSVTDGDLTAYRETTIIVNNKNRAPMITNLFGPTDPIEINTLVHISASFIDPDIDDNHQATCIWDDGSTSVGEVIEDKGEGSVTCQHMYQSPGVYSVKLDVTDQEGMMTSSDFKFLVVFDPSDGFVTGGGWIDSPAGAYIPDDTLTGIANFGFVSKYQKGAKIPIGNTEFQFKVADLNFHSSSYDWLVVNKGDLSAQYKGEGTINGAADKNGNEYKFMLWASDGAPDTFRIKIWWEEVVDSVVEENLIYDNGSEQPIVGGSIIIHTK